LVSYAIVSYDIRRDLHDPLRFFSVLEPIHFFRRASYGDMTNNEQERTIEYSGPADLLQKLRQARPQIVQGGEPFVPRLIPNAWAVLSYARLAKRPLIVPSLDNLPIADQYGKSLAAAIRSAARPYVRSATLAIAVNAGAEKNLRWAGAMPERLARMMYGTWGVDTAEFAPGGPRAQLPGGSRSIMFLGRVERAKGIFDLVSAMPLLLAQVQTDLVVVGDGHDTEAVKQAAQEAGVASHVHLLGAVKNKDVPDLLRSATVLVAPSRTTRRWAEQVGMSAIQAMACGVPVVSTRSGSIPEFVEDEVTGLLVPEGDPPALARALGRFLTSEQERLEFAHRARAQAEVRFDARKNIHAVEERILEASGLPR
jgi:glycosyltransferase involved in cell wall biosynthesis